MTEREKHDMELCHAFGAAACQMVEWIRRRNLDAAQAKGHAVIVALERGTK